jgi:hypothetical protein
LHGVVKLDTMQVIVKESEYIVYICMYMFIVKKKKKVKMSIGVI